MVSLFFWPLMIVSIISSLLGIAIPNHRHLYLSAVCILPLSLYLAATPRFLIWGFIFPIFYLASSKLIQRNRKIYAVLVNLPNYVLIGWLAIVVINQ